MTSMARRMVVWVLAMAGLVGGPLLAQDVTGTWQGTLKAGKDLRIILKITKDDGKLQAAMYSIDQGGQAIKATSASLDGSTFKCVVDAIGGNYEGKVSADGSSVVGSWTQGAPLPLTLVRATKETAWEIPAPPPPPKLMAADADPSFEVATIKPNPSGGSSMQGLTVNGRNFRIRNGSLGDMIAFAYNVQAKQIVGGPGWMDSDRYDIDAVPDVEGAPSPNQVRTMMRKLLADRFALKFHPEKRELSAYVLTVGKTGEKLSLTQSKGPLPGYGMRPGTGGMTMNVVNSTIVDFTSFMQMLVLDKPVVDHTELKDRYDFKFTFTPDDSQFNGHPPKMPAAADTTVEAAPNLFDAMQQQLGLKLTAEKTAVDVMVVDHVEKHSDN